MGRKFGDVSLFGRAVSPSNIYMARAEAYLHSKWHLDPSNRFATMDMSRQVGGAAVPLLGELCTHLKQCFLGQGIPPNQVAS